MLSMLLADTKMAADVPVTVTTTPWGMVSVNHLAEKLKRDLDNDKSLIIDSRSFLEFNTCHIARSVNVCCSKLVKRRLQQDKVSVKDLLAQTCHVDTDEEYDIIVYDQCTTNTAPLSADCFLIVLLKKLVKVFNTVSLLRGGFLEFQSTHRSLCESKSTLSTSGGNYKCPPMTSMSQPCLPVSNVGPTKILPFLYLGSQQDALSQETMSVNGISYVLNVSTACKQPSFIQDEGHFLRIPVNDNYSDKLLPYFQDAFQFLDKVRESNGSVLVHCLAGISRSPTLAIAYIMRHLNMTSEEAYKYVKDKRPTISPNFNFLGQLMEYEQKLKSQRQQVHKPHPAEEMFGQELAFSKKQCIEELRSPTSPTVAAPKRSFTLHLKPQFEVTSMQSPTTALAKLNFNNSAASPIKESPKGDFPQFPTTSLDKLNFTPCFANPESAPRFSIGKVLGGTKRPLSTSIMDNSPPESSLISGSQTGTERTKIDCVKVTRRSAEAKAKRSLVRPNSIAFSTYPLFDFASENRSKTSPGAVPTSLSPTVGGDKTRSPSFDSAMPSLAAKGLAGHIPMEQDSACIMEAHIVSLRQKDPAECTSNTLEQARKSRSLEDILNSPEEENNDCGCPSAARLGSGHHRHHRLLQASDMFSQPTALDRVQCRCRGPTDPHQSSSSISSSGSHNSLHGSMELIQVS